MREGVSFFSPSLLSSSVSLFSPSLFVFPPLSRSLYVSKFLFVLACISISHFDFSAVYSSICLLALHFYSVFTPVCLSQFFSFSLFLPLHPGVESPQKGKKKKNGEREKKPTEYGLSPVTSLAKPHLFFIESQ